MDPEELREAKEAVLAVLNNQGERAESLLHSWERSYLSLGAPDTVVRIPHADDNEIDNSLFELCRDQIHAFAGELAGSGQGILLADAAGRVVQTWTGDRKAQAHLRAVNTERGADLSEEAVGTNGLGTAITSGKGIQIRGAEHYADFYTSALCMGEPVVHPESGQVLGAVVLSGDEGTQSNLLLPLLRGLVAQMQLRILRATDGFPQQQPESARGIVGVAQSETERLVPQRIDLTDVGNVRGASDDVFRETPAFGGVSVGGVDVGFTRDEDGRHSLRLLGEATSTRVLQGNAETMPIVRDSLWEKQLADVAVTLRSDHIVMLVGESGIGKATLAAMAIHRVAADHPLKEIDAVRAKVDGWETLLKRLAKELDSGRGLVVRGAECLTERERIELRALFTSADDPYMALTTTTDYGAASSQTVRATVASTVVLPSLREQPRRIVNLWESLAQLSGRSRSLSARAQAAIKEYRWPGNLRELNHAVATTHRVATGAEIDIGALPEVVRSTPIAATMIERAERHALLQALEQAQGNRSQAAAILGVSRATIYRKIKQYKLTE